MIPTLEKDSDWQVLVEPNCVTKLPEEYFRWHGCTFHVPIHNMKLDTHFNIPTTATPLQVAKSIHPVATYYGMTLIVQQVNWFDILAVRVIRPISLTSLPYELRRSLLSIRSLSPQSR